MVKKTTITCKVCGGEHAGLICTRFQKSSSLPLAQRKTVIAGLLAPPPKPKPKPPVKKKKKKAKKAKRHPIQPSQPASPEIKQ